MDAIEFIRERNRMCATYTPKRCEGCPADNYGGCGVTCIMIDKIDAERLVPIVEKWSAEHPRKTRQNAFLEQYPDTELDRFGVIQLCPASISATHRDSNGEYKTTEIMCADCRRGFWMQEVE